MPRPWHKTESVSAKAQRKEWDTLSLLGPTDSQGEVSAVHEQGLGDGPEVTRALL